MKIWVEVINLRGDARKNGDGMGETEMGKKPQIYTMHL